MGEHPVPVQFELSVHMVGSKTIVTILCVLILSALSALPTFGGGNRENGRGGDGAPRSRSGVPLGNEDVDYLGVAAVMIRDGNYGRAASALEKVNPNAEGTDTARYYTLRGLVNLRVGDHAQAADDFQRAIDEGQEDPVINVYLAHAYYSTEQYQQAIDIIDSLRNLNQYSALYGIKAECLWQLGEKAEAYAVLSRAVRLFPSQTQFLRQRIFYLIDLDLTQEAAEQSVEYLAQLKDNPDEYVAVGEALRRGGLTDLAIRTLEMGRVRFPGNERVLLALAQAYLSAEMPRSAGHMVETAAVWNNQLYRDAAEIYRRAGAYPKALFLNSQIVDQNEKARQRFNLLIGMGRYEEALALEPRLSAVGVLSEDNMRYSIAYALFQTRQLDRASQYVNQITSSEYFRRATQLRRAIETVRLQDYLYY